MRLRFRHLAFIFTLCFGSFLSGWLIAVFILPGNLSKKAEKPLSAQAPSPLPKEDPLIPDQAENKNANSRQDFSFFEKMKDNILFLFDPYKMDSFIKKNTRLEDSKSPIKSQKRLPIALKAPLPAKKPLSSSLRVDEGKETMPPLLKDSVSEENFPATEEERELLTLQKLQAEYDKKNRAQLLEIVGGQSFFALKGRFSFLVSGFSEQEEALKYVENMKKMYPMWSFLLKAYKDHVRVYLGPFLSKDKALEFKKTMPSSAPFKMDFLEEAAL